MSVMVHSVHNNIVLHIGTPCCLFWCNFQSWLTMLFRAGRHMCHAHARPCLSTGWALNHRFGLTSGTAAVLAQGGGGGTVHCFAGSMRLGWGFLSR